MKVSLDTNIVSLALESIKVGVFPPRNDWQLLLMKAVVESSVICLQSSRMTPDLPGASGTLTERTKCSASSWVESAAFALDLCPKLGGNCPSLPPPGQ